MPIRAGRALFFPTGLTMRVLHLLVRACGLALVLVPGTAFAAPGDSATFAGTASAELVDPGRLVLLEDLRFGAFLQPLTAGTLTVVPDGTSSGTGGVAPGMDIPQPPEGRGPASFRLDGTENRRFVALIPNRITISNGAATMQIRNITTNLRPGSNRFNGQSQFILRIGGTLQVAARQAVGEYSGDFEITVIFQ